MMVRPVNQQNVDRSSPQGLGRGEAAKAASNDYNQWNLTFHFLASFPGSLYSGRVAVNTLEKQSHVPVSGVLDSEHIHLGVVLA